MDTETVDIEFNEEEFDLIRKYQDAIHATTLQHAIMNAITIALDWVNLESAM